MKAYPVFLDPTEFIVRRWHGVKFTMFECPNHVQMFVCFSLSLPCRLLSLSPREEQEAECAVLVPVMMRRTVTRGACHPLTLPPTR